MRCLIVEDEFTSRRILQRILSEFGHCDVAVDGEEACDAYRMAVLEGERYDVVFLDIMLPGIAGQEVLKKIRDIEAECAIDMGAGARVIMMTSLSDAGNVMRAFRSGCESYLIKPVDRGKLIDELRKLGFAAA